MQFQKSHRIDSFSERAAKYFALAGPIELFAVTTFWALIIVLNILSVLHQRFNTDEPAHLHIMWAWTQGQIQYRDVFSNNMPLFHLLFAPIVALLGERATILYWMRFILLPTYFITAWCTYKIAARLFSRRAGIWAVIGLSLYGGYRNFAFQFRADNLWTALWLLCVLALISRAIDFRRTLVAGLLFGLCFAISMKSIVLLMTLFLSAAVLLLATKYNKIDMWPRKLPGIATAFLGATALPSAAIMLFFAWNGVWRDFEYGVFDYNLLAERVYRNKVLFHSNRIYAIVGFATVLVVCALAARWVVRNSRDVNLATLRTFVLLLCSIYFFALHFFWPPISRTYLPNFPLAFALTSGALFTLSNRLTALKSHDTRIYGQVSLTIVVALAEVAFLMAKPNFWKDESRPETNLIRSVVALTGRDEPVLDCKGETIFRSRAFRPALERIEMMQIEKGLAIDNAAERCIETQTHVVATLFSARFSPRTREFIQANYLPVGDGLSVVGKILHPSADDFRRADFDILISAPYEIVAREGAVAGLLDGTFYTGARFLAPGRHTFTETSNAHDLVALWAQAADRGFVARFKKIPPSL
jgi:hypothetical protein